MIEEYRKEHLCEPTVEQIAQQTGIPPEEVVMSFEAAADVESITGQSIRGMEAKSA